MPVHPQFHRHIRALEAQAQPFAQAWMEAMLEAMRNPGAAGLGAMDSRRLSGLLAVVEPLRMHVSECLSGHLLRGIQGAQARALGRGVEASPLGGFDIAELTLVDEAQAEKDIEISRVVQLADLRLEWELRELQALAAAMLPELPWGQDPTACGPAVFARAVSQTVYEQALEPEQQALWMRVAAPTLVARLRPLLAALTAQLLAAGVQPSAYRTIRAPESAAVQKAADEPASAAVTGVAPEQLQRLLRSLPLLQTGAGQRPPVAAEGGAVAEEAVTHALLGRLFERLLADPQLVPALRDSVARLEGPVRQLASHDPAVLASEQHPAWALINRITGHAAALPAHHARGEAFQRFVEPLVSRLTQGRPETAEVYAEALQELESFIDEETQEQIDTTLPVMDELGQREAERRLLPLMRDQVETQLAQASDVSPMVQTFLRGPWIEVLARVMATEGAESPEAQALVGTVDELLASLQRPATAAARADMRRRLPRLIGRLQQGMALIELPQQHRNRLLAELMQTHRRQLAEVADAASAPAAEPAAPEPVPEPVVLNDWQGRDTHIGSLPTVPMALAGAEAGDPAEAWIAGLRPGRRCKLHLQGVWATAQLAWASDNGAFFMFTSNLAGGMHSMTRRAVLRLRREGLATDLAEATPVQRAVSGLLLELAS